MSRLETIPPAILSQLAPYEIPADVLPYIAPDFAALCLAKRKAEREGNRQRVWEIACELRDLCAYLDRRPWRDMRGDREPGEEGAGPSE
jgi:hypothetical protein